MLWPMFPTRSEDLARTVHRILVEGGVEAATMRAIARRHRTAPGTLTNAYGTRAQVLAVTASVVGRLLAMEASDRVSRSCLAGLLPGPEQDDAYHHLLLAWTHLEAHALVCPQVAQTVSAANARTAALVDYALSSVCATDPLQPVWSQDVWILARGLQRALLEPGSELDHATVAAVLAGAPSESPFAD